jgi:hypothetical protein
MTVMSIAGYFHPEASKKSQALHKIVAILSGGDRKKRENRSQSESLRDANESDWNWDLETDEQGGTGTEREVAGGSASKLQVLKLLFVLVDNGEVLDSERRNH